MPSATEPRFALQRSVDKVYDSRAAQSARLMVPIASSMGTSSNGSSAGRRSPSPSRSSTLDARRPSATGTVHHRRSSSAPEDGAAAESVDPPSAGLSALQLPDAPETASPRKGRFRKAFGALTGR